MPRVHDQAGDIRNARGALGRVPVVVTITGLGCVYICNRDATPSGEWLYRCTPGARGSEPEDRRLFVERPGDEQDGTGSGSGVDAALRSVPLPSSSDGPVFLMSRLLRDKGVLEYCAAAKALRGRFRMHAAAARW
jgi:hypothetical protein